MVKRVPFHEVSLKAHKYREELLDVISSVIRSGVFFNGGQTKRLQKNLLSIFGRGFITSVASGHDALALALSALRVTEDDEIIFPVNAVPTAFPICLSKGKPVPLDVDENGQINHRELAKKINRNTRAVVMVHLYGLIGDIEGVLKLVKKRNIALIEDCAQAFGSCYRGKPVGTFGDIGCFSFYPTKNLGTLGDGGAIWTSNKKFYDFFLMAKSYGEKKRYFSTFLSFHSRLPEIQAGILNVYLKNFQDDSLRRREVASYYMKQLEKQGLLRYVRPLKSIQNSKPLNHLFVVDAQGRDGLKKYLAKAGVVTDIHYPTPVHLLPAFKFLNGRMGDFPTAELLSQRIIDLPFHSFLSTAQVDQILKLIKRYYD